MFFTFIVPKNPATFILQKYQDTLHESLSSMQPDDLHKIMTVLQQEQLITEEDKMAFTEESNVESIISAIKKVVDSQLKSLEILSKVLSQYSQTKVVAVAIQEDYGAKF